MLEILLPLDNLRKMEKKKSILIGSKARNERKKRILLLVTVVKGNRGWRDAFLEDFPHFNNKYGLRIMNLSTNGNTDDVEFLRCLEIFIPKVQKEQPAWFVKQLTVEI